MKLREIMTDNVVVIGPDAPLRDAARKMRDRDVGPLPVCDGERLVGMLTDRDIVISAVAEGRDPETTKVSEAMTPDVAYCFEDQDSSEAMRLMERHQIRRLPIVNRAKRLVGIVSLGDLARKEDDELRVAETLREISEPTDGARR